MVLQCSLDVYQCTELPSVSIDSSTLHYDEYRCGT